MFGLKLRLRAQLKAGNGVNTPSAFLANQDKATKRLERELRNKESRDVGFQSLAPKKSPKRGEGRNKNKRGSRKKRRVNEYCAYDSDGNEECGMGIVNRALQDGGNVDKNAPWENPNLSNPVDVTNINQVIFSLKGNKDLFRVGEDPKRAKESQKNFYDWLEEYCRICHRQQKISDDSVFIS